MVCWETPVYTYSTAGQGFVFQQVKVQAKAGLPVVHVDMVAGFKQWPDQEHNNLLAGGELCSSDFIRLDSGDVSCLVIFAGVDTKSIAAATGTLDWTL